MRIEYQDRDVIVRDNEGVHLFTWEFFWEDHSGHTFICVSPDGLVLHQTPTGLEWVDAGRWPDDDVYMEWEEENPRDEVSPDDMLMWTAMVMDEHLPIVEGPYRG